MNHRLGGLLLGLIVLACAIAACGHERYVEGRICAATEERTCYSGPPGTAGVGACRVGHQQCYIDESGWNGCSEVVPKPEDCSTPQDDDCDGETNEEGEGCECLGGMTQSCYLGPEGTEGVGLCAAGIQSCNPDGTWGTCREQILPEMEEDCDRPGDEDCDGIDCAGPIWGALYGNADAQTVGGITSDSMGNAILVGSFAGTMKLGDTSVASKGNKDLFVVKLDSKGVPLWVRTFGGSAGETGAAVAVDPNDDVVVAGSYASPDMADLGLDPAVDEDALIAKLDGATGEVKWALAIGESGIGAASSVAIDADGVVYVGGSFEGVLFCSGLPPCLTSAGGLDGFLGRVSPDGDLVWLRTFGGTSTDVVHAVAPDFAGNVVVAGAASNDAKWGAFPLSSTSPVDLNFVIAKVSAAGSVMWASAFGDAAAQTARGIATTPEGDILVCGQTASPVVFGGSIFGSGVGPAFIAKISSAGSAIWGKAFGDTSGPASANALSVDANGNILVTGAVKGTIDLGASNVQATGKSDAFLVKLDPAGDYLWSKVLGAPDATHVGQAVAFTPSGKVLFAVDVNGPIDFGLGPLTSAGSSDVGVVELQP